MSNKLFAHYPPCASKKLGMEFDRLIASHPILGIYVNKVEAHSPFHCARQVEKLEEIRGSRSPFYYLSYATLFSVTRFSFPPSYSALVRRSMYAEDRFKLGYHRNILDECEVAVFVPHEDGKWSYDMYRNAKRHLQNGRPAFRIVGSKKSGWNIVPLTEIPRREDRLSRKETLARVGEYAEPPTHGFSIQEMVEELTKFGQRK